MKRNLQNRTDKRVSVAVGLLAAVLALLGSQQQSRRIALPSDLGVIAYRAAAFGTLAIEQPQAASRNPR